MSASSASSSEWPRGVDKGLHYFGLLAFIPLVVVLATAHYHPAKLPDRWAYAYYYAFGPSVIFSVAALVQFRRCDKLWLGTNLWFALLGALSASKAWGPLELLATEFKESGGFVVTAAIGIVACVVAPGSFIGEQGSARSTNYAWRLTAVACAVAALSYFTQGARMFSITLPASVFVGVAWWLRRRLQSAIDY